MAKYLINHPENLEKVSIPSQGGDVFELEFPTADVMFDRVEGDLVLNFDDGSQVTLEDFFVVNEDGGELPTFLFADGSSLPGSDFLSALDIDVSPAAGPTAQATVSSALGSYDDGSADLISGIEGLGKAGVINWEQFAPGEALHAEGTGIPGRAEGSETPGTPSTPGGSTGKEVNYSARAVFHDADQTTDGQTNFYLLDAKGQPLSFQEGMEFTAVSKNGYFNKGHD